MARVQREYWQKRNRMITVKLWVEIIGLAGLTFIAAGLWLMAFNTEGIVP